VLGSRGAGGFDRLVLGFGLGAEVAAHAPVPVIVVRGEAHERREVVVGVDASDRGHHALSTRFGYAPGTAGGSTPSTRSTPARPHGVAADATDLRPAPGWLRNTNLTARELLADAVAPWALKYPAVESRSPSWRAPAPGAASRRPMVQRSWSYVLARARRVHRLLLGSVTRPLLRHAACPVAVAR
jgi:hypothetical protein